MNKMKLNINEVKEIEFEILKYIKEICESNGIRYSLDGGTLLGAVRHNGFIPWDDDIDIMLPQPDYDKLVEILSQQTKYKLYYDLNDDEYFYEFAKLVDTSTVVYEINKPKKYALGVWVDIFPVSTVPNGCNLSAYLEKLSDMNTKVFASMGLNYCYDVNLLKRIIKAFVKIPRLIYCKKIGTKQLKINRNELRRQEKYEDASLVGTIPAMIGERAVFPKSMFEEYTTLTFENTEFAVIKEWDRFLTQVYGDYMVLPPIDKRNNSHFDAYRLFK